MRILLSTICVLIGLSSLKAQDKTVQISGHALDLSGKQMFLRGYSDHVTASKVLLDESLVDSTGHFLLEFESEGIRYVELVCDHIAAQLYTSPGSTYDIEFPVPSKAARSFGAKAQTEVIFNNLELSDINALIIDFNYNYETFFAQNYELLRSLHTPKNYSAGEDTVRLTPSKKRGLDVLFDNVAEFQLLMDSAYRGYDTPYFKLHRSSVIGDLMLNSPSSPRELYETYIEPYPLAPHHMEYMNLHKGFFRFYLSRHAQSYGPDSLNSVINEQGDYEALKRLFSKDDFLADPERMDAVIILALTEVWSNRSIGHQSAIEILKTMSISGASGMTRELATEAIRSLTACHRGFEPMNITYENEYAERKQLRDSLAMPLVIEFWAPWCSQCDIEREQLRALSEQYEGKFKVLSVQIDDGASAEFEESSDDAIENTMTPSMSDWVEYFRVKSLPYYVIIDSDGKVLREYAPLPSDGIAPILHKLSSDSEPNKPRRIGRRRN